MPVTGAAAYADMAERIPPSQTAVQRGLQGGEQQVCLGAAVDSAQFHLLGDSCAMNCALTPFPLPAMGHFAGGAAGIQLRVPVRRRCVHHRVERVELDMDFGQIATLQHEQGEHEARLLHRILDTSSIGRFENRVSSGATKRL
jgi:hypothetical protein